MQETRIKWHQYTITATERELHTKASCGLSRKEARSRWRRHGANTLFDRADSSDRGVLWRLIKDPSVLLFLFSCLLCILFDDWIAGLLALIGFAISVALMVMLQGYEKGIARNTAPYRIPTVTVLRDGRLFTVSARNLVKGDVLLLSKGDVVPADCRLIEQSEPFKVLSARQGEDGRLTMTLVERDAACVYPYGQEISLQNAQNMLCAGMEILDGTCRVIVVATGKDCVASPNRAECLPSEKKRTQQDPTLTLSPYLRFYSLILYVLFLVLFIVALFTYAGQMSVLRLFLPMSTVLLLSSQTVWELCLHLPRNDTIQKGFDKGSEARVAFKTDTAPLAVASITDVFVFGSSAVTDGKRHLYRAFCGNTEVDLGSDAENPSLFGLSEALCIYRLAEEKKDADRTREDLFLTAREELLFHSHFDMEALKMRMRGTTTYLVGEDRQQAVFVEEGSTSYQLLFTDSLDDALRCTAFELDSTSYRVDTAYRNTLTAKAVEYRSLGCYPLFILRSSRGALSFVGLLGLKEALQQDIEQTIEALKRRNVRVTWFFDGDERGALADPRVFDPTVAICAHDVASRDPFALCKLYEKYRVFHTFSAREVGSMIAELRKRGHRIAYLGNRTDEFSLMQACFCSFVCDSVAYHSTTAKGALFDRLMHAGGTDDPCTAQTMRCRADAVVCRADRSTGGLHSVLRAVDLCRSGQKRMLFLLRLLPAMQIPPLVTVLLSSILGRGLLDGLQLLCLGWIPMLIGVCSLLVMPLSEHVDARPISSSAMHPSNLLRSRAAWFLPLCATAPTALFGVILCHAGLITASTCTAFLFLSTVSVQLLLYAVGLRSLQVKRTQWIVPYLLLLLLNLISLFSMLFPHFARILAMQGWNLFSTLGLLIPILSYLLASALFSKKKNGQPRK